MANLANVQGRPAQGQMVMSRTGSWVPPNAVDAQPVMGSPSQAPIAEAPQAPPSMNGTLGGLQMGGAAAVYGAPMGTNVADAGQWNPMGGGPAAAAHWMPMGTNIADAAPMPPPQMVVGQPTPMAVGHPMGQPGRVMPGLRRPMPRRNTLGALAGPMVAPGGAPA